MFLIVERYFFIERVLTILQGSSGDIPLDFGLAEIAAAAMILFVLVIVIVALEERRIHQGKKNSTPRRFSY